MSESRANEEVVAVFHGVDDMERAVESLFAAGFAKGDVSMLASEDAVEQKLGHRYEKVEELEDEPEAPRVAYRSTAELVETEKTIMQSLTYLPAMLAAGTVVASTGVVAAAVTGAALGGMALSTVLAQWLDKRHADRLQEQLEHGGLLLWVRVVDAQSRERALSILRENGGDDVHAHSFAAA
ncbi:MAG: hypothetical protein R3C97_14845 [Geminicoccaceae bacterium]